MLSFDDVYKEYKRILLSYHLSFDSQVWGYIFFRLAGCKLSKRSNFKFIIGTNYFRCENISDAEAQLVKNYIVNLLKDNNVILLHDYNNNMEEILKYNKFYIQFDAEKFHHLFLPLFRKCLKNLDPTDLYIYQQSSAANQEVRDYIEHESLISIFQELIDENPRNLYVRGELYEIHNLVKNSDQDNISRHTACTKLHDLTQYFPALNFNPKFNDLKNKIYHRYHYVPPISFVLYEDRKKYHKHHFFTCCLPSNPIKNLLKRLTK